MIAGIVLKLYVQHRAVSLSQRTDRLEDVDVIRLRRFVIPACKVVCLRSGAARHALVGVVGVDPDQTHTVNLLYGIEAAIAIGAIDRFAHATARLSPCRELVSSQRAETVAASVIDHVVETEVAAVAVFRRSQQLEAVGKHHPCGTCCMSRPGISISCALKSGLYTAGASLPGTMSLTPPGAGDTSGSLNSGLKAPTSIPT